MTNVPQVVAPMSAEDLIEPIRQRDAVRLAEMLLVYKKKPMKLYPTQGQFAADLAWGERLRVVFAAHTRYGKTVGTAAGLALRILMHLDEPIDIAVIGPQKEQAFKVRNEFADILVNSPTLLGALPKRTRGAGGYDYLQREASRKRIVFDDGKSIEYYWAHGSGNNIMGSGAYLNVETESSLISNDQEAKVFRMAAEHADASMVKEGNTWSRQSHFYRDFEDEEWTRYHVPWQVGVAEGSISERNIIEQRKKQTALYFTVFWDCLFPEDHEDSLFTWDAIQAAINRKVPDDWEGAEKGGLDVAEKGLDKTVLVLGQQAPGPQYMVYDDGITDWAKSNSTKTFGHLRKMVGKSVPIVVDAIGEGSGVYARLKEGGLNAVRFKSSWSGSGEKRKGRRRTKADEEADETYTNAKASGYVALSEVFERGMDPESTEWISIPNHPELIADLLRMRSKLLDNGKTRVYVVGQVANTNEVKEKNPKSPDFSDALMMFTWGRAKTRALPRYA